MAQAATARAGQVKDFVASIFTQAVPRNGSGGAVVAADLLRAATRRVETDPAGQPAVATALGALIGASFNELGETRTALDWLPRAATDAMRAKDAQPSGRSVPLALRWLTAHGRALPCAGG